MKFISSTGRVIATLVVVCVAAVVGWNLWLYYQSTPSTRDGRLRANVITVASNVAGQVLKVGVHDDQTVKKGDVLFQIDPARYQLAADQAKAELANAQAALAQASRDADRFGKLGTVTSTAQVEQAQTAAIEAQAAVDQATSAVQLAQLNLTQTAILSPANGVVTNLALTAGSYVGAGTPVMAVVDSDSFYVAGYFEETKLANIHVGDPARIYVMGQSQALNGHVSGISAAIGEPDRTTAANLLPSITPSFTWVRLAQRVPVDIKLDNVPAGIQLVAGRTTSVDVLPRSGGEALASN